MPGGYRPTKGFLPDALPEDDAVVPVLGGAPSAVPPSPGRLTPGTVSQGYVLGDRQTPVGCQSCCGPLLYAYRVTAGRRMPMRIAVGSGSAIPTIGLKRGIPPVEPAEAAVIPTSAVPLPS